MNGGRVHWAVVGLAAIVGALAALLAAECLHRSDARSAFAQPAETAGSANYVLALMGNTVADATPIVLIDTKSQTIMIYEYMVSTHTMFLRLARKYDADRELFDNGFYKGNAYTGPSRDDIGNLLRSRR
jgi:hypothetical protein